MICIFFNYAVVTTYLSKAVVLKLFGVGSLFRFLVVLSILLLKFRCTIMIICP